MRRPRVVAGDQDHRERGDEAGDRPDHGRDDLRVDALHPRQVGVLGRRLDRAAEQRAVEEPAERDRHQRHDDEHRELRTGDAHPGDVVQVVSIGDRVRARRSRSISGYAVTIASASPAIPMVATSTMTRGAENSRRIDDELHDRAEERADDQRGDRGEPERDAVVRRRAARAGSRRRGPCCRPRS